jgi:hypothetical protein
VFTEEGVGEILQVGWRYQQGMIPSLAKDGNDNQNDADVGEQQQQLYLQIYDKTKLGYNDENSMLQGGVEQHQYWGPSDGGGLPRPPTTNTTETGTTMTPPSSGPDPRSLQQQGPGS